MGAAPRKLFLGVYWYEFFFPLFWCGEFIPQICPSIFGTPYILLCLLIFIKYNSLKEIHKFAKFGDMLRNQPKFIDNLNAV
jgi:hypothetical protein